MRSPFYAISLRQIVIQYIFMLLTDINSSGRYLYLSTKYTIYNL